MAAGEGDILWKKDDEKTSEHNEIWDDTALIEAYDRAVSQMKEVISKKNKNQVPEDEKITGRKKNKKRGKGKRKPKNHSEGMEWIGTRYGSLKSGKKPAKKPKKGTVSHSGENNPYLHQANGFHHQSFMPPHACRTGFQGFSPARQCTNQLHGPSSSFIPDIPPPPPFPLDDEGVTDDEALASMLMSWYMSGYHTGYYQALRQMRSESCECQGHIDKKCCLHCSS
ncbi:survival motor neuron protein 1-like isoform X3 [Limulus polyphemus]|uniref:Survival motor neuron protein 1-like isoform X3 n=1 Tax=Limulus polyphemus TaxID=6850 RepID=A0ABM1SNI5_LIMPO|nr:survival motor neuron protein 1-like isoform X3 [Limulus polyphemus]